MIINNYNITDTLYNIFKKKTIAKKTVS